MSDNRYPDVPENDVPWALRPGKEGKKAPPLWAKWFEGELLTVVGEDLPDSPMRARGWERVA